MNATEIKKYQLVYKHGLLRLGINENNLPVALLERYKLNCEKMVTEDTDDDLAKLCKASAYCLEKIIRQLDSQCSYCH
jgi:hypothetical protein